MARKIAVNLLKERGAKEVLVHLAYVIGVEEPVMATSVIDGESYDITGYGLKPQEIIEDLDLQRPIYLEASNWGHFGRGFSWDS